MSQNEIKGKPRIHAQLASIMTAVEAVGKARTNQAQGFKFRGIEDVMDALHPIFAENKVFILSEVESERTEERTTAKGGNLIYRVLKVKISFVSGEDGSRESVTVIGEGMDSGDKASNKAMSIALKYALTQTLILPFAVIDPDADTPPGSTKPADKPAATLANAKSAHDGRTLKPGESALPAADKPPEKQAETPPAKAATSDQTAFNGKLYDMMALVGVSEPELVQYLRSRGLMTETQSLHNLSEKFVDAMLNGRDKKTGKNNFDLVVENIKKARAS